MLSARFTYTSGAATSLKGADCRLLAAPPSDAAPQIDAAWAPSTDFLVYWQHSVVEAPAFPLPARSRFVSNSELNMSPTAGYCKPHSFRVIFVSHSGLTPLSSKTRLNTAITSHWMMLTLSFVYCISACSSYWPDRPLPCSVRDVARAPLLALPPGPCDRAKGHLTLNQHTTSPPSKLYIVPSIYSIALPPLDLLVVQSY